MNITKARDTVRRRRERILDCMVEGEPMPLDEIWTRSGEARANIRADLIALIKQGLVERLDDEFGAAYAYKGPR